MCKTGLRKIRESDKQNFFEMSRDFYAYGAAHAPIPDKNRENFWRDALEGKLINAYIVEHDGATAGYALVAYYSSQEFGGKTALLDELYIKPDLRGQGIAKKVFALIEADGAVKCRLEVEPDNKRAIRLYESLGYETFDYLQMYKKLK